MSEKMEFDSIPIGMEMGPWEMTLDEETVGQRAELVQWGERKLIEKMGLVPPGMTIDQHAKMKFSALPDLRASIWAKSEHEFLGPMRIGSRITIRGRVVDKYVKRGRQYIVSQYETVDQDGNVLLRSLETGVHVE